MKSNDHVFCCWVFQREYVRHEHGVRAAPSSGWRVCGWQAALDSRTPTIRKRRLRLLVRAPLKAVGVAVEECARDALCGEAAAEAPARRVGEGCLKIELNRLPSLVADEEIDKQIGIGRHDEQRHLVRPIER